MPPVCQRKVLNIGPFFSRDMMSVNLLPFFISHLVVVSFFFKIQEATGR